MPAIMMMPEAGVPASVTGSSSDMAEIGPMPGSTPTSVPMNTPMKQYSRLIGCSATPKPSPIWLTAAKMSMGAASADLEDAGRQLDQQQSLQHPPGAERHADRERHSDRPAHRIDRPHQDKHQRDGGEEEAERLEEQRVGAERRDDDQHFRPARPRPQRGDACATLAQTSHQHGGGEPAHDEAGPEQRKARLGIARRADLVHEPLPDHEDAE